VQVRPDGTDARTISLSFFCGGSAPNNQARSIPSYFGTILHGFQKK